MESSEDVVIEICAESGLEPLLEERFDSKVFATRAIQNQVVGETLKKLSEGILGLNDEIRSQIYTNHEDLLSQATGIESLEAVLKMMGTRVNSLNSSLDRINSQITDPYQKIVARTTQLARLQAACDLLRRVVRMLYLVKRLRSQVQGGAREITKVAQTFSEIDQLSQTGDLRGIEVIDNERPWLNRTKREVETQAKKMLTQGMEYANPTQVGVAVQVFYNLGTLADTVLTTVKGCSNNLQQQTQDALNPATLTEGMPGPGRSPFPTIGMSASWKAALWTRIEKLTDYICKVYGQVNHLKVVLEKKRDPISQVTLIETIKKSEAFQLLTNFWNNIVEMLTLEFATTARASTHLNQLFEGDYPKLVRLFTYLPEYIHRQLTPSTPQSTGVNTAYSSRGDKEKEFSHYEQMILTVFAPFEKAYLSKSLNRLFDAVNQLFVPPGKSLPGKTELTSLTKTYLSDLNAAGNSRPLAMVLVRNVEKAIKLYTMKCEELISTTGDAIQVSGPPNSVQLRNTHIANSLHAFAVAIKEEMLTQSELAHPVVAVLQSSMEVVEQQRDGILSNFVAKVSAVLEEMVSRMHEEDFSGPIPNVPDPPCSAYMQEMHKFASRMTGEHLAKYQCQTVVMNQLLIVSSQIMESFVAHVCLIRPLGEGGKMRVAMDLAQLELVLGLFCRGDVSSLGQPYKMLRALRRLLFLAPDNLLDTSTGVGSDLPYSLVLNHLFCKAPVTLKSPHKNSKLESSMDSVKEHANKGFVPVLGIYVELSAAQILEMVQGWSEKEYVKWMKEHPTEQERISFIQATVDNYNRRHQQDKAAISSQENTAISAINQIIKQLKA